MLLAAGCGLAAALPAPAPAATPTVTARVLTPDFSFPSQALLRYQLTIQAQEPERFNVRVVPPQYRPAPEAEYLGGPHAEGSPLGAIREWRIEGGQPGPLTGFLDADPTCSPRIGVYHGYAPRSRDQDLTLLAGQTATVTVSFEAGGRALWPSLRLAPTFLLSNRLQQGRGTLADELSVEAPEPARRGPSGVQIVLWTTPQSGLPARQGRLSLQPAQPVSIHLRTEPRLPGERIALLVADPGRTSLRLLRRVRLDAAGQATVRGWRPPGEGEHELWASYTSTRPDLVDDFACPRAVFVEGPGPAVTRRGRRPPLRLGGVRARRVRGALVVSARLRCGQAELPTTCRGRVIVAAGDRVVRTSRVAVVSGRTRRVRWRIRTRVAAGEVRVRSRPAAADGGVRPG